MVKNGHIHDGTQRYRCKSCGRQFVYGATNKRISDKTKTQVDKLLLEKLSLAGVARVLDVSETWLQGYVNQKYAGVKKHVQVKEKRLVIECDELRNCLETLNSNRRSAWIRQ